MKVIIHSGLSIEHKCQQQKHPVTEVQNAEQLILSAINSSDSIVTYSNSPDFVMAIKYSGKKYNVETEFYLNGISYGNDIESVLEDFNKSFELIDNFIPEI